MTALMESDRRPMKERPPTGFRTSACASGWQEATNAPQVKDVAEICQLEVEAWSGQKERLQASGGRDVS